MSGGCLSWVLKVIMIDMTCSRGTTKKSSNNHVTTARNAMRFRSTAVLHHLSPLRSISASLTVVPFSPPSCLNRCRRPTRIRVRTGRVRAGVTFHLFPFRPARTPPPHPHTVLRAWPDVSHSLLLCCPPNSSSVSRSQDVLGEVTSPAALRFSGGWVLPCPTSSSLPPSLTSGVGDCLLSYDEPPFRLTRTLTVVPGTTFPATAAAPPAYDSFREDGAPCRRTLWWRVIHPRLL